ncbi:MULTISPECIES: DUF4331 family protein [unclassified Streptomyces]|uniref:DUF4331 family protein n=1 Tax=unclassified Streptomyces TaxID=2593676 RepID=UPI0038080AD5
MTFGSEPRITESGDFRFFAGLRGDPFFADKNVFGIVLDVPNSALGPNPRVGVWARVLVPHDGRLVQGDRGSTTTSTRTTTTNEYDRTSAEGFPNGRNLTDDVINMGIAELSNGTVPHDGLRPHTDLRTDFPFLGNPHQRG